MPFHLFSFQIIESWKPLRFWVSIPAWHREIFWNLEFPQGGEAICFSAAYIMRLAENQSFFSTQRSNHLPDFLPLRAPRLGLCVSFPCLWQHSNRCGGLPVERESWLLEWRSGVSQVAASTRTVALLLQKGQGRCCCLRGEVGCESWGAEVQVLLWCGDPVYNPSLPCWVLISSREDFLQHYYFLCISACTASVLFHSLAYYLGNCK